MWRRGYASGRGRNEVVSSFGGFDTEEEAVADAQSVLRSRRVHTAWVRNPAGDVVWYQTKNN